MIEPRQFLDVLAAHGDAVTPPTRGTRLGTVDAGYISGKPRVTLDGTTTLSADGFTFLPNYTPVAGDRVVLLPVGTTYVILGRPADEPAMEAAYQLVSEKGLANGYASLNGLAKVPILELPTGTDSSEVALGNHGHDPVGTGMSGTDRYHSRYATTVGPPASPAQSIPNTTNTAVSFPTTLVSGSWLTRSVFSSGHFFSPQVSGIWTFGMTVRFVSTASGGERYAAFVANDLGSQQIVTADGRVGTGVPGTIALSYTAFFSAGTFIFVEVYQSTGAALNLDASPIWRNFNATLIRRCT